MKCLISCNVTVGTSAMGVFMEKECDLPFCPSEGTSVQTSFLPDSESIVVDNAILNIDNSANPTLTVLADCELEHDRNIDDVIPLFEQAGWVRMEE